jgi:hypothetical protein
MAGWDLNLALGQGIDPRLTKILADWQKRQDRINGVRYAASGTESVPKGAYTEVLTLTISKKGVFPREDWQGERTINWLIDFTTNRARLEDSRHVAGPTGDLIPNVTTSVFNGYEYQTYAPRAANSSPFLERSPDHAELTITSGKGGRSDVEVCYCPMLIALGIVPSVHHLLKFDPYKIPQDDQNVWRIHGESIHRGHQCIVLRSHPVMYAQPSFDECWVDPSRESAVVRYIIYSGKNPWSDYDIRYEDTPSGWLPSAWTTTMRFNGKIFHSEEMQVNLCEINPSISDEDFELSVPPGTIVAKLCPEGFAPTSQGKHRLNQIKYRVADNDEASAKGWILPGILCIADGFLTVACVLTYLKLRERLRNRPRNIA